MITFICAIVVPWAGAGWVDFVAMSAFITTLIFLIFYITGIYGKLPGPWMLIVSPATTGTVTVVVVVMVVNICVQVVVQCGGGGVVIRGCVVAVCE